MHPRPWLSFLLERARFVSCALGLSVGCGDGYIGRECPASAPYCTRAEAESNAERLELDLTDIPPGELSPFVAKKLCGAGCANPGGILLPGPQDSVWSMPRGDAKLQLQLIGPDGVIATHTLEPPPAPIAALRPAYASNNSGDALLRLQWDVARSGVPAPGPDELAVLQASGVTTRLTLQAQSGVLRLPLGVIPAPAGYLLYPTERGTPLEVQFIAEDGKALWKQSGRLPREASASGGAAVALRSGGYMVAAYPLGALEVSIGLMQLAPGGLFLRYLAPHPSTWRNIRMLPLAAGRNEYALAAEADLLTVAADDGTGNLEIMRFAPGRDPVGVRILRDCYHAMTIKGFAAAPDGSLFVSTVAGDRQRPHALLCRLSNANAARCFAGETGLILEEIVATSERTLFAAAGDEILRIELPE